MKHTLLTVIVVAICYGLLTPLPLRAASVKEVSRSEWEDGAGVPSYVKMYIYVPDKLATNPPIVVSNHACQSPVSGQYNNNKKIAAAADKYGFIMIFPDNPGRNCWDVGAKSSLTHDGKGDTHGVAQMVRYVLKKYNGDSTRVYVVGGSSGGMMTQALCGVYPELFAAGVSRAGVPCGCWAESYASGNQWSGPCAGGSVKKTAEQWGDYVRAINPDYTGHRPRMQIMQGDADRTISSNNMGEAIKQWTNVLDLNEEPDSTATISSSGYTYNCKFWKNDCGYIALESWFAKGGGHSMKYEEDAILKFFGLDSYSDGDPDPGRAMCDSTGIISAVRMSDGINTHFALREMALVLNRLDADEVSVKVMNTSGRIQYNKNHKVGWNTRPLTVPLSFLPNGCYITSVTWFKGNKRINTLNTHFIMMK